MPIRSTVHEKDTPTLRATFADAEGAPVAPSSVQWAVWCLTNEQEIRPLTAAAPPAVQMDIQLESTDTRIVAQANPRELRRVTVIATHGTRRKTEVYEFEVLNRHHVT